MEDAKAFTIAVKGGFKLVLVGRSENVFGTRMHVVKGQPRGGHATRDEAKAFAIGALGVETADEFGARVGDGQFISAARLKASKPEAFDTSAEPPQPKEWKDLPLANLYAAGIAAKAYIEKSVAIERLRAELDEEHAKLARAIGLANADKMIAGLRAEHP